MPIIKCKCGKETNTALCFHINNRDDPHRADYCYLAWENNGWVKGCYYDKLNPKIKMDLFLKEHADKLLAMNCNICGRFTNDYNKEKHHLIPRAKGGKVTEYVCIDCGNQVHKLFTNKELAKEFNTIEKLKANEKVQKWINWVRNKQFGVCMKAKK
jgi:5-methylcytosine-specific restriction endonuclease McrA